MSEDYDVAIGVLGGEGAPARHTGVIASGGDVIASKDLIAAYRKDMPKLIGVEMEGGGVAAALHGHVLRPRFLMVRGVSDLADAEGNVPANGDGDPDDDVLFVYDAESDTLYETGEAITPCRLEACDPRGTGVGAR